MINAARSCRTLLIMTLLVARAAQAGWVDDWFDNAVVTGRSSYENQQRGFYTAGGFSARVNVATDYPITVSLPRLDSGCGGVDLFLGGMSFLDEDYLVEKFQNIIQAAPALAFDIALKVMAKELSDSMSKLESATNWLNSLQLDDCAISKRVVATVAEDDPEILGSVWNEITSGVSLRDAVNKSYDDAQQDIQAGGGDPIVDLKAEVSECSADFQAIFAEGSIIDNAAQRLGIPENADIIRGYVGDVVIRAGETDLVPIATRIEGCAVNDRIGIEDMLIGEAEKKAGDGTCSADNAVSVIDIVSDRLTSIAAKMENKDPLSSEEIAFIENSPVPIYSILRKAIATKNVPMTTAVMTEVVATAYAYRIFDDLYRNTHYMFRKVGAISTMPGVDGASTGNRCNLKVYAKALGEFGRLFESVREVRREVSASYVRKVNEQMAHLEFARAHEQEEKEARRARALEVTR